MARKRADDFESTFIAARRRLQTLGSVLIPAPTTIGPHVHHASEIVVTPETVTALIAADDAQEGLEELGYEKLARSGEQPWLGPDPLDMAGFPIKNIDALRFELDPENVVAEGDLQWSTSSGIDRLVMTLAGTAGLVQTPLGGVYVRVKNSTGINFAAAVPVHAYDSDFANNLLLIDRLDTTTPLQGSIALGLTMQAIDDGAEGWICCHGYLGGVDLSGYNPADKLNVNGLGTMSTGDVGKGCGWRIRMGIVIDAANPGSMWVSVEHRPILGELSDVEVTYNGGPDYFDHPQWLPSEGCDAWRDYPASLFPTRTEIADFAVADKNVFLFVDAGGADVTVTLPTATGTTARIGRVLHVKKIDATRNLVIIDGDGTEPIDGELTQSLVLPQEQMSLICLDGEWRAM